MIHQTPRTEAGSAEPIAATSGPEYFPELNRAVVATPSYERAERTLADRLARRTEELKFEMTAAYDQSK